MEQTWRQSTPNGITSLVHPESHFTEKKAAPLRRGAYVRLRKHFQFVNELNIFDADHHVSYGIHVYGPSQPEINFINASSLYHPKVALESLRHNGEGPLPGFRDDGHNWDCRPHRDRIVRVDRKLLEVWHSILEDEDSDPFEARMVYSVNTEAAKVLEKLAAAPRVGKFGLQFSRGWDESIDKKKGYFDTGWAVPQEWEDVIIQGPHLGVSTPMIKQPNPTLKHNQDWIEVDLESLRSDFKPATAYQSNRPSTEKYDQDYGTWKVGSKEVPTNTTYRVAWRKMAATTGYRTLYPAIIPMGSCHIDGIESAGPIYDLESVCMCASLSSLLSDFMIRSTGIANIRGESINRLPFKIDELLSGRLSRNFLRLNCLTDAYAPLWESLTGEKWTAETPLRLASDRRMTQIEIDAIIAYSLGITIEEICMIYRTQFPVMRKYDQEDYFDVNGRKVPKVIIDSEKKKGNLPKEERTWQHPQSGDSYIFEGPFEVFDREIDLQNAYDSLLSK